MQSAEYGIWHFYILTRGMTIKQDMVVNNQGQIFQSGNQTTTCIFTALLDLDCTLGYSRPPSLACRSQNITSTASSVWSQFDPAILGLAGLRHNPSKEHINLLESILVMPYTCSVRVKPCPCDTMKSFVFTFVVVTCSHICTSLYFVLHGHLQVKQWDGETD